jgi:hypothetical protein
MLSARLDRPSELTDHERRAWLRHVLQHGDLAAYVADTFEDDV